MRSIMAPDFSPRITSDYAWYFAFKGQFLDLDTGYYNYGYRYYSPELGRWLSRDPIGESDGINIYAFTNKNTCNNHDIYGLLTIDLVDEHINDQTGYDLNYQLNGIQGDLVQQDVTLKITGPKQFLYEGSYTEVFRLYGTGGKGRYSTDNHQLFGYYLEDYFKYDLCKKSLLPTTLTATHGKWGQGANN